jgi:hypothetical protein
MIARLTMPEFLEALGSAWSSGLATRLAPGRDDASVNGQLAARRVSVYQIANACGIDPRSFEAVEIGDRPPFARSVDG